MAVCGECGQEMTDFANVLGCKIKTIMFPDGKLIDSIPYQHSTNDRAYDRCHDCYALCGQYHHPGCDMERCPRCDGQLITCGCLDPDKKGK